MFGGDRDEQFKNRSTARVGTSYVRYLTVCIYTRCSRSRIFQYFTRMRIDNSHINNNSWLSKKKKKKLTRVSHTRKSYASICLVIIFVINL